VHKKRETTPASPPSPTHSRTASDEAAAAEDAQPSIYHTLLALYLTPPPPHEPNLAPALDLLSRHGSRLPAASTLSLIPDALPVRDLEGYFRGRIRSANSVVNEARVVTGLRAAGLFASQAALLLGDGDGAATAAGDQGGGGRNRRVGVTEERLCGVCHKRLGGSVVAALPDNSVVHYGCLGRAAGQRPQGVRVPTWGRAS